MYKYILLLLLLPIVAVSQNVYTQGGTIGSQHRFTQEQIYQKTTYTTSLLDTTAWFLIEPFSELALVVQSTDSAVLDIYCDARNKDLPNANAFTTYADSLVLGDSVAGGANSGERRNVLIKTTTLNRLNQPGNNEVRFRIDHRASNAGTTAGRVLRVWLIKNVF